jgi:transposase
MPTERLSMRKVREVLTLRWGRGLSERAVAGSCGLGRTTVQGYVIRAERAGLRWPLPEGLNDECLEALLFPAPPPPGTERVVPDWAQVHRELKRKGVTLWLLWEEYKAEHPDGFQYSWFCKEYQTWAGLLDPVMRQVHKAGERLFVDYAGQTMDVVDRSTGELHAAQIFVATSGASSYTFAEATWTQQLPDWIESHNRAMAFFGGVHELLVPDNLKAGVTKPCWYEPEANATYQELAEHYGAVILPARPGKSRDKAKVEVGVQGVEQRILARLRNHTFFSLLELNLAISNLLREYNEHPFQKLPGSRRSMFEDMDKPALKPLPEQPYRLAQWKKAKVHVDYHVAFDAHYYSVPYQLNGKSVWIRATSSMIEILHNNERVTSHVRSCKKGGFTTKPEHMPKNHREHLEWTPERFLRWADKIGPGVSAVVEAILASRPHPQQGYRSCLGIMRLERRYGADRLDAACKRALAIHTLSYKSIASILEKGLDRRPLPAKPDPVQPIHHENIRGHQYYFEPPVCQEAQHV